MRSPTTHVSRIAAPAGSPTPGRPPDHHPDARAEQIAWARGTLASPAGVPDAQLAHACRCLLALSRDGHDHTLAREMLALIERKAT